MSPVSPEMPLRTASAMSAVIRPAGFETTSFASSSTSLAKSVISLRSVLPSYTDSSGLTPCLLNVRDTTSPTVMKLV